MIVKHNSYLLLHDNISRSWLVLLQQQQQLGHQNVTCVMVGSFSHFQPFIFLKYSGQRRLYHGTVLHMHLPHHCWFWQRGRQHKVWEDLLHCNHDGRGLDACHHLWPRHQPAAAYVQPKARVQLKVGRPEGVHHGARGAKGSETKDARLFPDGLVDQPRHRPFPGDEGFQFWPIYFQVLADYPEELRGDVSMHLHKEVSTYLPSSTDSWI